MNELETRLHSHVRTLSDQIGERNVSNPTQLAAAADYIKIFWESNGFQIFEQIFDADGEACRNLWIDIKGTGRREEIVVAGAHYDSALGARGGNDNGSGVAAVLELSVMLKEARPERTLRFALFPNEEPPYFLTPQMGSYLLASASRAKGEKISAMLSLETIGYYTDAEKSQKYPPLYNLFYPSTGNFLAVVGDLSSSALAARIKKYFRESSDFPVESVSAPRFVEGVGWSDHAAFWEFGYPAVMLTDTAFYRYPYYHTAQDTSDKLNYPAFARVTVALREVLMRLAEEG